jgi:hypothetical protein
MLGSKELSRGPGFDSKSLEDVCWVEKHIFKGHLEMGMHHLNLEHPQSRASCRKTKSGP